MLQLQKDIEREQLPSALLIYGDRYSGRMTTALEIARVLSCARVGLGTCDCPNCMEYRALYHPYLMVLAKRDHLPEIEAAGAALRYARNHAAKLLFIRTVRIMLGVYRPVFIDAAPQAKKALFEQASEIDELLHDLLDADLAADTSAGDRMIDSILKKVRKVASGTTQTVPVGYIRNISVWLHATSENYRRVVIIEGIDEFNDSAVNSMLKILEEPPANVSFILIARKRNTIIPTILSRVRTYYLGARPEAEADVISRVYHDSPDEYDSLQTFFTVKLGIDCRKLRESAESYLFTALDRRITPRSEIEQIITEVAAKKQFSLFLTEITSILEEEVADGLVTDELAYQILDMISDLNRRSVVFHQGDALLAESLYYRIAAAV